MPGVYRVITPRTCVKVIPNPYYGPAFHDQPILAMEKVRFVGEPVAVVLAADPHVAEAATHAIVAEYEEMEPVLRRSRGDDPAASYVHEELKPAGTFADLKHLKGQKDTNLALNAKIRLRRRRQGLCRGGAGFRARIPHPEMPARPVRAARLDRRRKGHEHHDL